MKPIAYEGAEPYIFVSYAHKDADCVYEVLNELQARDYRFWYDDGIAPGSEWPEDIARHLDGASMVIAFITQNSMNSQNCRREINFSLSREKRFLSVLMEETDMPLGMQMQLSAQQSIVRYNYATWEGFIDKVLTCPDLAPCKRVTPQTYPAQSPVAMPEAKGPSAEPEGLEKPADNRKQFDEKGTSDAEAISAAAKDHGPKPVARTADVEPEAAPVKEAEPVAAEVQATAKPRKKGKPGIIALIAAAIVVALVLAGTLFSKLGSAGDYTTSWGTAIEQGTHSVNASGRTLTQEDLEAIAKLEELSSLTLTNCDLSQCSFAGLSWATTSLKSVDLSGSIGIDSYDFLSNYALTSLHLSGCSNFSDLQSLNLSEMNYLYIDGTAVSSLAQLSGATKLQELNFSGTSVANLQNTSNWSSLRKIVGSNTQVASLDSLSSLEKLTYIDFTGAPVSSISGGNNFAALSLETLLLGYTQVTDLSAFADCTRLKSLGLYGCAGVTDLSWLDPQNYASLESLQLSRTGVSGESLSWIAQCTKLKTLTLSGIAFTDLSFCSTLTNLTFFRAENCGITDISPLSNCTALEKVILNHNAIEDISPLANLSVSTSTVLDLSYNKLSSLKGLADGQYRALLLYGNSSDIANTLPTGVSAYVVVAPWFETAATSTLQANRNSYSSIYLVGCPQNQVLATEDAFGSRLKLVSEDELWQLYEDDAFGYSLSIDWSYFLSLVLGTDSSATDTSAIDSNDSDSSATDSNDSGLNFSIEAPTPHFSISDPVNIGN